MGRWGRRGGSQYGYRRWPEYVPVAERRARAVRETEKLKKKGQSIEPVEIEGRTIAHSFWGKGWCTHLESFGDYSNRLPRGRTYVRNGSVCHLGIARGEVDAIVAGSSLYNVKVSITPLDEKGWSRLKSQCTGRIGSLLELLQGRLSDEVMRAVTDVEHGLFPKPGEIRYTCDCPDWASMCKHIAAVMYGIGARLDEQPELLFRLRGVDHDELIGAEAAVGAMTGETSRRARRRVLDKENLSSVFGVDLENDGSDPVEAPVSTAPTADRPKEKRGGRKPSVQTGRKKNAKVAPSKAASRRKSVFNPTGQSIAKLRVRCGMSKEAFARKIGVTPATVSNWEKTKGKVAPHSKNRAALQRLHSSCFNGKL